mmetsp:Transcript_33883/g.60919  ORF Transcript_33883/g.60919 Transcript_33883/m.60919 type:complete len:107 (+) Transcript_33883:337-657(+)
MTKGNADPIKLAVITEPRLQPTKLQCCHEWHEHNDDDQDPMGGYSTSQKDPGDGGHTSPSLSGANAIRAIRCCFFFPLPFPFLLNSCERRRKHKACALCASSKLAM